MKKKGKRNEENGVSSEDIAEIGDYNGHYIFVHNNNTKNAYKLHNHYATILESIYKNPGSTIRQIMNDTDISKITVLKVLKIFSDLKIIQINHVKGRRGFQVKTFDFNGKLFHLHGGSSIVLFGAFYKL
jgi:predicted transcriptional regulator